MNGNHKELCVNLAQAIIDNKEYLSEIDGLIGDGDHGINMSKGFSMYMEKIRNQEYTLKESLGILSDTLMLEIGGSMGPLYGMFFLGMSEECEETLGAADLLRMLKKGLENVMEIGDAKRGDKTLLDTLIPAVESLETAIKMQQPFPQALEEMKRAAEAGKNATKDMVAKVGRASRLGERSRGVLDAGATSCNLILQSIADSLLEML